MAVTIRDIARTTGYSIGTVARALKNQGGLTGETRTRICATARAQGYDVGNLRQGEIRRIAFLLRRCITARRRGMRRRPCPTSSIRWAQLMQEWLV